MDTDYTKLITREKTLLGDVSVTHDLVSWPVRLVRSEEPRPLDAPEEEILRAIRAGYIGLPDLMHRLRHVPGLAGHLDALVGQGVIRRQAGAADSTTLSIAEGAAPKNGRTRTDYHDAVSGAPLTLPEDANFVTEGGAVAPRPVVAVDAFDAGADDVRLLPCLIMLATCKRTGAKVTRVFHQFEEVACLQQLLLDLVLAQSARLDGTALRPAPPEPPAPKVIKSPPAPEAPKARPTAKAPAVLPTPPAPKALPTPPIVLAAPPAPKPPGVQIIMGRYQHEQALGEALRAAKQQVVIVTPFLRRRLSDRGFLDKLRGALRRGVRVSIIHGMPNYPDQFDDPWREDERIEETRRAVGAHHARLRFHRVTESGEAGEHSKILICDRRWVVVSSFNWLSQQETNETGVRVEDPDAVARILAMFQNYLGPDEQAAPPPPEPETAQPAPSWPMSSRQMSEWLYGEYNSQ